MTDELRERAEAVRLLTTWAGIMEKTGISLTKTQAGNIAKAIRDLLAALDAERARIPDGWHLNRGDIPTDGHVVLWNPVIGFQVLFRLSAPNSADWATHWMRISPP